MSVEAVCLVYRVADCAVMFGVDERTIKRREERGKFPKRLDFDTVVVYDRAEVDAWFKDRHNRKGG